MLLEGTVLEAVGGTYRVLLDDAGDPLDAVLRGRLKKGDDPEGKIVPGDRVRLPDPAAAEPAIEEVLPRRSRLVRAGPGGRRPKVVAANLDRLLVVLSADAPPFRREVADRFLVLAESCGIPPLLVVNKLDLAPEGGELRASLAADLSLYRRIGYPVLETSVVDGRGLRELGEVLSSGISSLVGPSGVGKSALLNAVDPELDLRTREVSRRGRRGRHTTVSARMVRVRTGGWVVDTPGFSEVSLWGTDPADLPAAFPEFREPSEGCRFRGCRHREEPDCGVKEALEAGEVDEGRYRSYLALMDEAEEAATPW